MSQRLHIGVIFGGRSGEHEISVLSAENLMQHFDPKKYEVIPIGITKDGQWISQGYQTIAILKEGRSVASNAVLMPEPGHRGIVSLASSRRSILPIDVYFPILHGSYGEDGAIQGLLELTEVPYVSCGVFASSVGIDKVVQKQLFQYHRIPVIPFSFFYRSTWEIARTTTLERIEDLFSYPMFVKPARLGSSVGISRAIQRAHLIRAIHNALLYDEKVIVEQGIEGAREFECGVLGNTGAEPTVSAVGEVIVARPFYDYHAKYLDPRTKQVIPAKITKHLEEVLQRYTKEAFHAIEGAGMSRVDYLYNEKADALYLNEINTIPGFTKTSSFPKLWEAVGVPLSSLLDQLIRLAIERFELTKKLKRAFTSKQSLFSR